MSFIMPSRRSTTNLLQASGELWSEDAEQAPLQFVVLAPGSSTDPRVDAVLGAATQLAPDDIALHPVAVDDLPPFAGDLADDGPVDAAVRRYRDDIALADGFLLIAAADDAHAQELLLRAVRWAGTPAGEDALADLPVVWLGIGGDPEVTAGVRLRVRAAVEAGGGVMVDEVAALAAPLTGDWSERIGPGGRLDDVTTRQAVGQVLMRLRQSAFSGEGDVPAGDDETDG